MKGLNERTEEVPLLVQISDLDLYPGLISGLGPCVNPRLPDITVNTIYER